MFIYIGPNCIITFTVDKYVNTPHTQKKLGFKSSFTVDIFYTIGRIYKINLIFLFIG